MRYYQYTENCLRDLFWISFSITLMTSNVFEFANLVYVKKIVSHLLATVCEIYIGFDNKPVFETQGIFLDTSKAFDKAWHAALICKLKLTGISGNFLKLIKNFLDNRSQRVLLNGQTSNWLPVKAGVPQGSILGLLFFLIYINDLPDNLAWSVMFFADDNLLFPTVYDTTTSINVLNDDLKNIGMSI